MAQNWWDDYPDAPVAQTQPVAPRPVPSRASIPLTRGDPSLQLQRQKLEQDINLRQATADADRRKAEADARKAEADAALAGTKSVDVSKDAQKAERGRIAQLLSADSALDSVNTARRQAMARATTGNFFGGGGWKNAPFIGQNAADLNATLEGLRGGIINNVVTQLKEFSASGSSGYGALTEKEAERLAGSVAALNQEQSREELLKALAKVEFHYRNAQALLNNEDPRDERVQEKYGIVDPYVEGPKPPSGRQDLAAGEATRDPALAGVNRKIADMIKSGRSESEIRDYLNVVRPSLGDRVENLGANIAWSRANPNATPSINIEESWTPTEGLLGTISELGRTPFGAAVTGAADTLTMGALDSLTGNPEEARAVMSGIQQENPLSYLGGQVGGGAATGFGLEGLLARRGLSTLAAGRGGDILAGSGYSAGSADEADQSRLANAALGGLTGYAGGELGRRAFSTAGRLMSGAQDENVRYLNQAGVPMTMGQILGGGAKRTEDRIAGMPFVGDQIRARRIEGMEGFNRAAFDEGLSPIGRNTDGVIGAPGIERAQQARSAAYDDTLSPVRLSASSDPQFQADMQSAIALGETLPEPMRSNAQWTLANRVGNALGEAGDLTGRDFQQVLRGLRGDARSFASQPYGYDFGGVTRQAEGALEGMLERQAPGALEGYQAANRANMNVSTLRDAVSAARSGTQSGATDVFTPAQLSNAANSAARRFGGAHGTTRQPFFDLTRAGQEVLPSSVPDSGTAGRLAIPLAAGAIFGGGGAAAADEGNRGSTGLSAGLAAALLASAPYSASARSGLQRALLGQRPETVERVGDMLINRSRRLGMFGAPLATVGILGE